MPRFKGSFPDDGSSHRKDYRPQLSRCNSNVSMAQVHPQPILEPHLPQQLRPPKLFYMCVDRLIDRSIDR